MTPIRRVLASALLTATALTVGAEGETTQADDAETAMEVLRILLGPSSPLGDMLELDLEGLEGVLLS